MTSSPSLAARGQRLGLRLLSKAGGLPIMANPDVRAKVEKALTRAAHEVSGPRSSRADPSRHRRAPETPAGRPAPPLVASST